MRCHQYIGLTKEAEAFLLANVERIVDMTCPKCGEVLSTKLNILKTEHEDAFYGDGPTLSTYKLKDGRIAQEIIQESPWWSGPICLEIDGKRFFEWKLVSPEKNSIEPNYMNYEEGTYWI
jgi:hypothetical protein